MTDQGLSAASDLGVWVTVAVLALAMLAFTLHLAVQGPRQRVDVTSGTTGHRAGGGRAETDPAGLDGAASERPADRSGDGGVGVLTGEDPPEASTPTRRWGVLGLQLTLLATFVLVAATALRGLSVQRAPLGNMYEFALVACCFALVVYSGWSLRRDRLWLGLFVVMPVLLILGASRLAWYTEASALLPSLESTWLVIHVTVATLTVGLFIVGFALACLFLLRERAERLAGATGVRGWLAGLPRAATLERLTYGVHVIAFPLWSFTLVAGAIWAEQAWGRYWGWDSKEVWTFVIWAVYAAYLHARATAGVSLRRTTMIAIAGFVCVIVNYTVVNLFFVGLHSYSGV